MRTTRTFVLLGFVIVSAAYVWWHLRSGWIPIDDGPVAHSAERVLRGELPHRDFDELYTGGLAFVNAAGFRFLGTNLWTLRLVLFGAFVAWLPAVFYVVTRFTRPLAAAGMGFLAVVWSVPNYPGAMASWYNLFLATMGVAALLRWLDHPRPRWLFVAGLIGGVSILVKVIGLYYVAGVLLFLVYHVQAASPIAEGEERASGGGYAAFVTVSLLLFIAALLLLVRSRLRVSEFVQFVLPSALVSLLLIRNEWRVTRPPGKERAKMLLQCVAPFVAGIVLPLALFGLVYTRAHAVGAMLHGVFVAPQQRLAFIAVHAPAWWTMLALVPFAALAVLVYRTRGALTRRETVLLVVLLLLALRATGGNGALYRTIWFAARSLLPALAIVGVVLLARASRTDTSRLLRQQTVLLLAVTCMCSLAQYPYTTSVYFCYVAPLVVLLLPALYSHVRLSRQTAPVLLVAFFTMFAVLRTNATRIASVGSWYQAPPQMARLTMERGGVDVPVPDARNYGALVTKLRAHARGEYTWASPDAPEVYFLSGLRNPTRTLFEVFDAKPGTPDEVMRTLDSRRVTAVVLGTPSFSPPISPDMYARLSARYPHEEYVGSYLLRWRD